MKRGKSLELALLLLLLLTSLCSAAGMSLSNGTIVASLSDGSAAGNANLPTLGAGVGLGVSNSSSGATNTGASQPSGGAAAQSNSETSGSSGNSGLSASNTVGGSIAGSSGGGSSDTNSALMQAPKEKQYEKCTGPGDPGPCKQYIYKWRFEPTTGECTTFIWGGCDGNPQNRFNTEPECLFHCVGGPRKQMKPKLQSGL